jgi:hypothetical protein
MSDVISILNWPGSDLDTYNDRVIIRVNTLSVYSGGTQLESRLHLD